MDTNRSHRLNLENPLSFKKRGVDREELSGPLTNTSLPLRWETAPGMPKNSSPKNDNNLELNFNAPFLQPKRRVTRDLQICGTDPTLTCETTTRMPENMSLENDKNLELNLDVPFSSMKRHVSKEEFSGPLTKTSHPLIWETAPGTSKNSSQKNDKNLELNFNAPFPSAKRHVAEKELYDLQNSRTGPKLTCKTTTKMPKNLSLESDKNLELNLDAPFSPSKRHVSKEEFCGPLTKTSHPLIWETAPGTPKNLSQKNENDLELNFNAPFSMLKRHTSQEELSDQLTKAFVPFSWETAPGLPKNLSMRNDTEYETPRLKLPPGKLKILKKHNNGDNEFYDAMESFTPAKSLPMKKHGTSDQTYQDKFDVLSLTQAIDMVELLQDSVTESDDETNGSDSNDYLTTESTATIEHMSPNYMIERFLPDAAALAADTSAALAAHTSAASERTKKRMSCLNTQTKLSCFSPGLHMISRVINAVTPSGKSP